MLPGPGRLPFGPLPAFPVSSGAEWPDAKQAAGGRYYHRAHRDKRMTGRGRSDPNRIRVGASEKGQGRRKLETAWYTLRPPTTAGYEAVSLEDPVTHGLLAPHHRRWTWRAVASAGHAERAGNRAPEQIARPAGARPPIGRRIRVRTRPSGFPIPAFARTGFAGLTAPNACSSSREGGNPVILPWGFRRKLANRSRAHCVGSAIRSAPSMRSAGSRSSSTG